MNERRLKIRFSKGDIIIEIDGDSGSVISQLDSLKEKGVGRLMRLFGEAPQEETTTARVRRRRGPGKKAPAAKRPETGVEGFPSLNAIALGNLPQTEPEWIAVYAYFASDAAQKGFTRKDLWDLYKQTKRDSRGKSGNLSYNINRAVRKGWLSTILPNGFELTKDGLEKAREIAGRENPLKKRVYKRREKVAQERAE